MQGCELGIWNFVPIDLLEAQRAGLVVSESEFEWNVVLENQCGNG